MKGGSYEPLILKMGDIVMEETIEKETMNEKEALEKFAANCMSDIGRVSTLCKFMKKEPEAMFEVAAICKAAKDDNPEWLHDVPHLMSTLTSGIDKLKNAIDDFDDLLEHLPQAFLFFVGFSKIIRIMVPGVQNMSSCAVSKHDAEFILKDMMEKKVDNEA